MGLKGFLDKIFGGNSSDRYRSDEEIRRIVRSEINEKGDGAKQNPYKKQNDLSADYRSLREQVNKNSGRIETLEENIGGIFRTYETILPLGSDGDDSFVYYIGSNNKNKFWNLLVGLYVQQNPMDMPESASAWLEREAKDRGVLVYSLADNPDVEIKE